MSDLFGNHIVGFPTSRLIFCYAVDGGYSPNCLCVFGLSLYTQERDNKYSSNSLHMYIFLKYSLNQDLGNMYECKEIFILANTKKKKMLV